MHINSRHTRNSQEYVRKEENFYAPSWKKILISSPHTLTPIQRQAGKQPSQNRASNLDYDLQEMLLGLGTATHQPRPQPHPVIQQKLGIRVVGDQSKHATKQKGDRLVHQYKRQKRCTLSTPLPPQLKLQEPVSTQSVCSSRVHPAFQSISPLQQRLIERPHLEAIDELRPANPITQQVIQRSLPTQPPTAQALPTLKSSNGKADKVESTILPGDLDGGAPSVSPVGWDDLYTVLSKVKGQWVRFHILNRRLGGPGNDVANLIPTTHLDNHSPSWRQFETNAYDAHSKNNTIHWEAQVSGYYGNDKCPFDGFPMGLKAAYWVWNSHNKNWDAGQSVTLAFAPLTAGTGGTMLLHASELTAKHWQEAVGVNFKAMCEWLASNREEWKKSSSDIVASLEEESYKHESWGDNVEQATAEIKSALSGRRTKRASIYQGVP